MERRKPGPKPGTIKKYGKRRGFHILLSNEPQKDEAMSLAEAFEQVAGNNGGIVAYAAMIIKERPEIIAMLKQEETNARKD